jgi:hypothetical protein
VSQASKPQRVHRLANPFDIADNGDPLSARPMPDAGKEILPYRASINTSKFQSDS